MKFGRYDYASFLTYFSYAGASIVIPVALVEMASALGFPLAAGGFGAGGFLQLLRSAAIVASMVLCGFVAARWGKRRGVGWSIAAMGSGIGLCALAPGYGILAAGVVIAGLGEGIIEGLGTPFVQGAAQEGARTLYQRSHAFWSVGVFVVVLGSGALLALGADWRLVVGEAPS
jgi:MFS family permease